MEELLVETPEGVTLRYELAGAGSRAAAAFVDLLLFLSVWSLGALVLLIFSTIDVTGLSGFAGGVLLGGALLLPGVYQIVVPWIWGGRTPGKSLFGLRIASASGGAATPVQLVLRGLFWPLECLVLGVLLPVPLALFLIAASRHNQRLGDLVAGTVVLRDARSFVPGEPFPRERWSELPRRHLGLVPAHAARFDAEDVSLLRGLAACSGVDAGPRRALVRRAARHYLGRLGMEDLARPGGPDPRTVVRELYLFLRDLRAGATSSATPPTSRAAGAAGARDSARAVAASPR